MPSSAASSIYLRDRTCSPPYCCDPRSLLLILMLTAVCSWFHGDLSSDLAEKTIRKVGRKGAYLVRFSSRDPGCFAITTLAKDSKLKHYKVLHRPGAGYLVGKIETHTLEELVTKYAPRASWMHR